jgi:hypothetical protein
MVFSATCEPDHAAPASMQLIHLRDLIGGKGGEGGVMALNTLWGDLTKPFQNSPDLACAAKVPPGGLRKALRIETRR